MEKGFSKEDIPYQVGYHAHSGTSFSPERRAVQEQESYFGSLDDLYTELLKYATKYKALDKFEKRWPFVVEGYKKRFLDYLHSRNGWVSTMIAGPSNFPAARMNKKGDRIHNKLNDLVGYIPYQERKVKWFLLPEELKPVKTGSKNALQILQNKVAGLEKNHAFMKAVNKIAKSKAFNLAEKVEKMSKELGISKEKATEVLNPDRFGRVGFEGYYLTNNLANIKRLKGRIKTEEQLKDAAKDGNKEWTFPGGKVIANYEINRIQIKHDEKPPAEVRKDLKSKGFRWSPKNGVWQRNLNTVNFKYHIISIVGEVTPIKKADPQEDKSLEDIKLNLEELKEIKSQAEKILEDEKKEALEASKEQPKAPEVIKSKRIDLKESAKVVREFIKYKWPRSAQDIKVLSKKNKTHASSSHVLIDGGNTPLPKKIQDWFFNAFGKPNQANNTTADYGVIIYIGDVKRILKAMQEERSGALTFGAPEAPPKRVKYYIAKSGIYYLWNGAKGLKIPGSGKLKIPSIDWVDTKKEATIFTDINLIKDLTKDQVKGSVKIIEVDQNLNEFDQLDSEFSKRDPELWKRLKAELDEIKEVQSSFEKAVKKRFPQFPGLTVDRHQKYIILKFPDKKIKEIENHIFKILEIKKLEDLTFRKYLPPYDYKLLFTVKEARKLIESFETAQDSTERTNTKAKSVQAPQNGQDLADNIIVMLDQFSGQKFKANYLNDKLILKPIEGGRVKLASLTILKTYFDRNDEQKPDGAFLPYEIILPVNTWAKIWEFYEKKIKTYFSLNSKNTDFFNDIIKIIEKESEKKWYLYDLGKTNAIFRPEDHKLRPIDKDIARRVFDNQKLKRPPGVDAFNLAFLDWEVFLKFYQEQAIVKPGNKPANYKGVKKKEKPFYSKSQKREIGETIEKFFNEFYPGKVLGVSVIPGEEWISIKFKNDIDKDVKDFIFKSLFIKTEEQGLKEGYLFKYFMGGEKAIHLKEKGINCLLSNIIHENASQYDNTSNSPAYIHKMKNEQCERNFHISKIHTDPKRFQNREKLNQELVKEIADNFDPNQFDPVVRWYDKEAEKWFLLAGHHRLAGAEKAGRKMVKTRCFEGTEDQAKQYAKELSNANRTLETPLERAKIYRAGITKQSKKALEDKAKRLEGKNWNYILNIAHLKPTGKALTAMKALDNNSDKLTQQNVEKITDWTGEVRRLFPALTDQHENEIFDFLLDNFSKKKSLTRKTEWITKISALVHRLDFSSGDPLNLKRIAYKTQGETEYQTQMYGIDEHIKGVEKSQEALKNRFNDPKTSGYISPNDPEYNNLVKLADKQGENLTEKLKALRKQKLVLMQKKGNMIKGGLDQGNLFAQVVNKVNTQVKEIRKEQNRPEKVNQDIDKLLDQVFKAKIEEENNFLFVRKNFKHIAKILQTAKDDKVKFSTSQIIQLGLVIQPLLQSDESIKRDAGASHMKTLSPNFNNLLRWGNDPGNYDLIGVDSFQNEKPTVLAYQVKRSRIFNLLGVK